MLDTLHSSAFADRIGERFPARTPAGEVVELVLTRCQQTPYGDPEQWVADVRRVPFSLEFLTSSPHAVGQGIFAVADAQLGELDIFMTPLGPDGDAMRYEAVFS